MIAAAPVNTAVPTISGTAKDGQTLTSTTGTWTGTTPLTYGRQWRRCDAAGANCVDISGATATTYVVAPADVGKTLRVVLTATNAAGSAGATRRRRPSPPRRRPPTRRRPPSRARSRRARRSAPRQGRGPARRPSPTPTHGSAAPRPAPPVRRSAGATSATYRLVAADVTKTVRVVVTATNAGLERHRQQRGPAVVTTGPPVDTTAPAITGTANDGETLTSSTGTWAGTGTPTYARQWKRCDAAGANCAAISGATGATYVLTRRRRRGDDPRHGHRDQRRRRDLGRRGADSRRPGPGPCKHGRASDLRHGPRRPDADRLQRHVDRQPDDHLHLPMAPLRRRAGTGCAGIGQRHRRDLHASSPATSDKPIRAVVTATNSGGNGHGDRRRTTAIQAAAPVDRRLPDISGDAIDGTTLTGTDGTWTGGTPTILHLPAGSAATATAARCANIAGATAATYAVTADDLGTTLRFAVTATNDGGSATATSDPTAIVAPRRADQHHGAPTITGYGALGEILTVHDGSWTGSPNIAYTTSGAAATRPATAASTSLRRSTAPTAWPTRTSARRCACVVTATNGAGATSAATAATDIVGTGETSSEAPDTATRYDYDAAGRLKTVIGVTRPPRRVIRSRRPSTTGTPSATCCPSIAAPPRRRRSTSSIPSTARSAAR